MYLAVRRVGSAGGAPAHPYPGGTVPDLELQRQKRQEAMPGVQKINLAARAEHARLAVGRLSAVAASH